MEPTPLPIVEKPEPIYAGFWIRLGSLLLDFLFLLPIIFITLYINSFGRIYYILAIIPSIAVGLWYNVYLVQKYGGTPGKLVLGVKILKLNGEQVTWREAILRHSVLFALTIFGTVIALVSLLSANDSYYENLGWLQKQQYLMALSPTLFQVYGWANNVWVYGELIVLLTNKKKRAVHDFIAGTVIVKTKDFKPLSNFNRSILPVRERPEKEVEFERLEEIKKFKNNLSHYSTEELITIVSENKRVENAVEAAKQLIKERQRDI